MVCPDSPDIERFTPRERVGVLFDRFLGALELGAIGMVPALSADQAMMDHACRHELARQALESLDFSDSPLQ